MLIHHTIFPCEQFLMFIFLAECKVLNYADVGRRTRTASLHGWPLSVEQPDTDSRHFFFIRHVIPSIFNCLCIVRKRLAPTCCS